jgi:glycerophosphoryl diester phosphodiesterase
VLGVRLQIGSLTTSHSSLTTDFMLVLGHRGVRGEKSVAENSVASFDLALARGCDGFEFDVRLTADGQAVVCHDEQTKSGGLEIAQSLARALELPLLRDVLSRYRASAFLDIELKVAGLETVTAKLLRELAPARSFVVSSFLPDVLRRVHELDASIPLGLICESQAEFRRWPGLPIEYLILHHKLVRRGLVPEIKAAGKKLLVWTVNVPADMKRFSKWGVDGIISDYPERLVRAMKKA